MSPREQSRHPGWEASSRLRGAPRLLLQRRHPAVEVLRPRAPSSRGRAPRGGFCFLAGSAGPSDINTGNQSALRWLTQSSPSSAPRAPGVVRGDPARAEDRALLLGARGARGISAAPQERIGFRWWEGKRKAVQAQRNRLVQAHWTGSSQERASREDWKHRGKPASRKSLNDTLRSLEPALPSKVCKLVASVVLGGGHVFFRGSTRSHHSLPRPRHLPSS